jgi:hypothetical protein
MSLHPVLKGDFPRIRSRGLEVACPWLKTTS